SAHWRRMSWRICRSTFFYEQLKFTWLVRIGVAVEFGGEVDAPSWDPITLYDAFSMHSIRRTRRGARRQIVCCRFWALRNRLRESGCADRWGQSRTWIKVKNPKAPAATRAIDGTF